MLRSIVLAGGIVVFGALGAMASPLTDKYSSFWVFGDSLSDNGNLFDLFGQPPEPYVDGRFSDGPVWNEGILAEFEDAGQAFGNFAFGGATASGPVGDLPDLGEQIGLYLLNGGPAGAGSNALASLWFGANDILNAIGAMASESDTIAAAVAAAEAVGAGVRALEGLGITDFAVWNLPDIGLTPRYQVFEPGSAQLASDASKAFNAQLSIVLAGLKDEGIQVTEIDTFGLFNAVLAAPLDFDFVNTSLPCLLPNQQAADALNLPLFCGDATGFLYFDAIHPTAAAHAVLADTFAAAVPLPASGVLLAFGLGLLALRRRAA